MSTGPIQTGRLKKRSDFLRLRDGGRKWVSPTVIVQVAAAEAGIRTGFTATKKLGGAVVRNKTKRRLREALRMVLRDAGTPCDIVLIGREQTASCPFPALVKDLRWCLRKLEVAGHATRTDPAA